MGEANGACVLNISNNISSKKNQGKDKTNISRTDFLHPSHIFYIFSLIIE